MRTAILEKAKEDIPLYYNDFKTFWDESISNISDDELYEIYRATIIPKNYKIALHSLNLMEFDLLINEIFEDINSSFFLSLMGLYRSAHMHLRSSIELTLQLIYFTHHPIEFKQWQSGNFVLKHDKIMEYINKHPNFEIDIAPLLSRITQNWKKFSKHIHGESPIFFQCKLNSRKTNSFTVRDFNVWKTNYTNNIYSINKLLLLFFKADLSRFPTKSFELLTNLLTDADKILIES